ncbi:hypothetical protein EP7_001756 [Isosphaeraceae bacterium EP7]
MSTETPRRWGIKDCLEFSKGLKELLGAAFEKLRRYVGLLNALEKYRLGLQTELDLVEQPLLRMVATPPRRSQLYIDQQLIEVRDERNQQAASRTVQLNTLVNRPRVRVLITGEAGDGKSTVLKEFLARWIAESSRGRRPSLLPAFVRLGSLFSGVPESGKGPTEGAIFGAIAEGLRQFVKSGLGGVEAAQELVREARNKGELVVALDGVDECVDYDRAVREIRDFCLWCSVNDGNAVALTSRTSRLPTSLSEALPLRLAVEPLSLTQIYEFLDRWPRLVGRLASDLKAKLMASPDIRAFCSNPLVLTLVAHLYLEGTAEGTSFEIPPTRADLYDRVFKELLLERRENRGQPPLYPPSGKRLILRRLASRRFWDSTDDPERIEPRDLALAIFEVMKGPEGPNMGKSFYGLTEPAGEEKTDELAVEEKTDEPTGEEKTDELAVEEKTDEPTGEEKTDEPARVDIEPRLTPAGEALLDELQGRDGVLIAIRGTKSRGDGRPDAYRPSHRTLLEFLAAEQAASDPTIGAEAMRDRFRTSEFNLLVFYAALVTSPEAVLSLTKGYYDPDRYLKRARLLASAEAINEAVKRRVEETAKGIVDAALKEPGPSRETEELQALAAMAARGHEAFAPAREQLRLYIEHLAGGRVGGAELDRVIRASPDPLLGILYDLRANIAADWRAALIRGLAERFKSPDGPLALRRLVGFLEKQDPEVRHEAAAALARAVKEIPAEVRALCDDEIFREVPEAASQVIWPLERLLPGKIVYRLVEAANKDDGLIFDALTQSRRALTGTLDSRETHKWRRADTDSRRDARVTRLATACMVAITAVAFLFDFSFLFNAVRGSITGQAFQFTWDRGFSKIPAEVTRSFEAFNVTTQKLIEQVRAKHPEKQSLITMPHTPRYVAYVDNVPEQESLHFEKLKKIADTLDPRIRLTSEDRASIERLGGALALVSRLDQIETNFDPRWAHDYDRGWRVPGVWVYCQCWYWLIPSMLFVVVSHLVGWIVVIGLVVELFQFERWDISRNIFLVGGVSTIIAFVLLIWRALTWNGCSGDRVTWLIPILMCFGGLLLVRLISFLCRPQNRFIKSVREFEAGIKVAS